MTLLIIFYFLFIIPALVFTVFILKIFLYFLYFLKELINEII